MALVSTIIPTHNRADLLMGRAIPSVLAQTCRDWECIVVGDGTDDATRAAMADLVARDARFRFLDLPRFDYPDDRLLRWQIGGVAAFNAGIAEATGVFISYLADDDAYRPRHHALLCAKAARTGADIVYGHSARWWNGVHDGAVFGRKDQADPYDIVQGSYIYRRSLGIVHETALLSRSWDAEMWTRLIAEGRTFARVSEIVHDYFPAPENVNLHWQAAW